MQVTDHRCHLFDDNIALEGSVVADRRAYGVLLRESVTVFASNFLEGLL